MKVPPLAYILARTNGEMTNKLRDFLKDDQFLTADEGLDAYFFNGTAVLHQRP